MKRLSAALIACMVATVAHAGGGHSETRYTAYTNHSMEFVYSSAVEGRPVIVSASTEDRRCHFFVSLVADDSAGQVSGQMKGRVEMGACDGEEIKRAVVTGTVTGRGDKVVLDRALQIVVYEQGS